MYKNSLLECNGTTSLKKSEKLIIQFASLHASTSFWLAGAFTSIIRDKTRIVLRYTGVNLKSNQPMKENPSILDGLTFFFFEINSTQQTTPKFLLQE